MSQQRIVITGAAGFLGSHLSDRLLAEGQEVVGIDNLSMGTLTNLRVSLASPRFRFLQLDVQDLPALRDACTGATCIVHLAAFKIPRYGKRIDTLLVNSRGTTNVLEVARELGCKVVFASTSDVYGKSPRLPFAEDDDLVLGPSDVARWSYAASKLFDEHLALAYREAYGFPVTILRFFGSYGPRNHRSWWGGPQSVFIEAALNGEEIPVHGDGSQTRSFTYVSDTVAGIAAAVARREADGQIINIGSNREVSIVELARLIHRLCGLPGEPRIRFIPYSTFAGGKYEDVMRRIPDITRAERLLGVRAVVPLEEGLLRTIAWHREVRDTEPAVAVLGRR